MHFHHISSYVDKIMFAGSVDSDIKYMAALILATCLDL